LLLHGLGSRLEETDALAAALSRRGVESIAVDLPNHGHSGRIPFGLLRIDMTRTGHASSGPFHALDVVTAFVSRLGTALPRAFAELRLAERMHAIAGGSLGGALALRSALARPRWLRRVIAWSPGTVWTSFLDDPHHTKRLALEPGWTRLFGNRTPILRVREPEDADGRRRGEYIRGALFGRIPGATAPIVKTWWRAGDYAEARRVRVDEALAVRRELYDEWHRRWCSALEHDQMTSSLRKRGGPFGSWPWDRIRLPVLLMAGASDDVPQTRMSEACGLLAERARDHGRPGGRYVLFENTGHSIHDERPRMLAANIAAFLRESKRTKHR
jgi:alpha-beta hydrolase superfamily lysophospholipase